MQKFAHFLPLILWFLGGHPSGCATRPPPPPPAHRTFSDPIWNVWAEAPSSLPSFTPLKPLKLLIEHKYLVVVDLSALRYSQTEGSAVYSRDSSSSFKQWLDQHSDVNSADIDLLAIPDLQYFHPIEPRTRTFTVDVNKMRRVQRDGFDLAESPFKVLQRLRNQAPFSFATTSFNLTTGSKLGNGAVAFSIWGDGRPIDELSFGACIVRMPEDPCSSPAATNVSLRGVDLSGNGKFPDGALHIIDRQNDLAGVFRCNTCGWPKDKYLTWSIPETADWLADRIRDVLHQIGQAAGSSSTTSQHVFEHAGDDLYNVLFHSRDADLPSVENAFASFAESARDKILDKARPLTLFVRLLSGKPDLLLTPLGITRVEHSDGTKEFVGFNAKVETPLEYQDYSSSGSCLSNWTLFVPPAVDPSHVPASLKDVEDARTEFENWIGVFKQSCGDCVIENEDKFETWLGHSGAPESAVVLILSHHGANGLFFNDTGTPVILSSAIRRKFAVPSLAVIDACGTSEPGASEFIREFNFQGMNAVIATSTQVEPAMAGSFLTTMLNLLKDHAADQSYSISDARFEAVGNLRKAYGPKALGFLLVGNGSLRLCVPQQNLVVDAKAKTNR